jgi:hypothetical protein
MNICKKITTNNVLFIRTLQALSQDWAFLFKN